MTELRPDIRPANGLPGGNSGLLPLYRTMRRIRSFEERVGELFVRGLSAGSMLHLSIGEESAAAGVVKAMGAQDTFTTHHRGHGIFLARRRGGGSPPPARRAPAPWSGSA